MRTSVWAIGLLVALSTTAAAQSTRTKVDMNAPAIFNKPAPITAMNGLITRVETTVAMALALSCHPFEKSKRSASTTTRSNIPVSSGIL